MVQRVEHRLGVPLAHGLALVGAECLDLTLDVVDLGKLLQRELGDLAFVGRVQVEELAPGMRQAAHLGHPAGDQRLVAAAMFCTT